MYGESNMTLYAAGVPSIMPVGPVLTSRMGNWHLAERKVVLAAEWSLRAQTQRLGGSAGAERQHLLYIAALQAATSTQHHSGGCVVHRPSRLRLQCESVYRHARPPQKGPWVCVHRKPDSSRRTAEDKGAAPALCPTGRRSSKIVSLLVSCFTATYVARWSSFFPDTPLAATPMFDGRAVCYPTGELRPVPHHPDASNGFPAFDAYLH